MRRVQDLRRNATCPSVIVVAMGLIGSPFILADEPPAHANPDNSARGETQHLLPARYKSVR